MAAAPARSGRRRPRHGWLERPGSARMYRGTWLLVALPLLVAAFSVAHPAPLAAPPLPAAFDRNAAVALASDLARSFPDRSPGSPQALGAAQWLEQQVSAYGLQTPVDRLEAAIPGRPPRRRRLRGRGREALRRPGRAAAGRSRGREPRRPRGGGPAEGRDRGRHLA